MCGRAARKVREAQRPHPGRSYGRRIGPEDAPDNGAVRQHVEIIVIPFTGWAGCRRSFQEKHVPALFIKTKLAGVPKHGLTVALHVLVDRVNRRALAALSI
jgi:hypothetical protein